MIKIGTQIPSLIFGVRQGAQGAAPSGASLEPPWSLPGASLEPPWSLPGASLELRSQREDRDVCAVFLGQLRNHCLPMRRGHSLGRGWGGWWGVVRAGWGGGVKGEVILHDFRVAMVYWLERIFEIRNHIHENAFSLYTISKIMLKQLINCL